MKNKYKYKLLLVLSIIFIYGYISYFSKAGFPIKALLTFIYTLVFLKDEQSCKDNFHITIPSFIIGCVLTKTFKNINPEWFLFIGFILFVLIVYIYSYIKKVLTKN